MKVEKTKLDSLSSTPRFHLALSVGKKRKYNLLVVGFFINQGKKTSGYDSDLIIKKTAAVSLISEQKTLYVCLGEEKNWTAKILPNVALLLANWKRYDLDFDLSTFITKTVTEETVVHAFVRTWYRCFHSFLNHHTTPKKIDPAKFHLLSKNTSLKKMLAKIELIAQGVSFARNLQDQAPNLLTSEIFANLMLAKFKNNDQIECQVLDRQAIIKEKMNLLLAVNAGSQYEPRVVVAKYFGDSTNSQQVTVLLGKGITFDTGGYSLKPSNYQLGMKFDMSGGAIVMSTLETISKLQLKVNVVAIACLTDNAIGSKATLVESVIKSKSGKTVEITNTDAEGRLVLADGLAYALEHIKPQAIIELSTLTGAISITLGDWMTGAFVNPYGEKLYLHLTKAAIKANEPLWRLPVTQHNLKMMKSKIADLANANKDYKGASSNAAAFLFQFAGKVPFVHLDIAGTATKPDNTFGTGVMVQTLVQYFQDQTK